MMEWAQNFPDGAEISCKTCIVGSGAAGITLANQLIASGQKNTVLIESSNVDTRVLLSDAHAAALEAYGAYPPESGLSRQHRWEDKVAQKLYDGLQDQAMQKIDGQFLTEARIRAFGGTTNCWGGWIRHLDESDFQQHEAIAPSWPIPYSELYPKYYNQALSYCSIPPEITVDKIDDEAFWLSILKNIEFLKAENYSDGQMRNAVFLVMNGQRLDFQQVWGPNLIGASRDQCRVIRNANARRIEFTGQLAVRIFCSSIMEARHFRDFTVRAERFILATGGVEVPRLLLHSISDPPYWLGRCFQIHPLNTTFARLSGGTVTPPQLVRNLYGGTQTVPGGLHPPGMFCTLAPSAQVLKSRPIGNSRARVSFGDGNINLNWEQSSNKDSRVTLGDQRDIYFGDPLPDLLWNTEEIDTVGTPEGARELLLNLLKNLKYATSIDRRTERAITWPGDHMMGATRMSKHASEGCVDMNCKMHGIDNLFISSSSVFPRCGFANPTLTIIALAIRLADHLTGS